MTSSKWNKQQRQRRRITKWVTSNLISCTPVTLEITLEGTPKLVLVLPSVGREHHKTQSQIFFLLFQKGKVHSKCRPWILSVFLMTTQKRTRTKHTYFVCFKVDAISEITPKNNPLTLNWIVDQEKKQKWVYYSKLSHGPQNLTVLPSSYSESSCERG
jgi:hypothetical protein